MNQITTATDFTSVATKVDDTLTTDIEINSAYFPDAVVCFDTHDCGSVTVRGVFPSEDCEIFLTADAINGTDARLVPHLEGRIAERLAEESA